MANPNAKGNPNFGRARGEFYIDIQKDNKAECEKFTKVWNEKPEVHSDKKKKNSDDQARYTLLDYVLSGAFNKWVKLPDDEEIIVKKILPSIRAKANELRDAGYKLKMREAAEKLNLTALGRQKFVIAWEQSNNIEEVADTMIAKGVVKGDYSTPEKKKSLCQSLRYVAGALMKGGLALKTDFYAVNIRISDEDFIEYYNANTSWATMLASLQEDGLASSEKKIKALKMQKERIEKECEEKKEDSPFTVEYASRAKIKDEVPELQKLLAKLRGGSKVEVEESEDEDGGEESEEKEDEDEDEGEVSEEETVSNEDPFA